MSMKKVRRILLWLFMLNKRLLFKKSFIILLCLIPLLVLGMKMVAKEESGVLTVMLCAEQPADELATQLIRQLLSEDGIIRYIEGDEASARAAVADGSVDCAWLFRENFRGRVEEFTQSESDKEACIYIIAKEDSIPLMLARTKLYGSTYPELAYYFCKNFLQYDMQQNADEVEELLPGLFEQTAVEDVLFEVVYTGQQDTVLRAEQQHYLLSPVTGLLLVFLILCGFAAVMFYYQDRENGIFSRIPVRKRLFFSCCYPLVAILDGSIVVWLSLALLDREFPGVWETLHLLLYVGAATGFCCCLRELFNSIAGLGRGIPLILIVLLLVSPIFVDVGQRFWVQYLSPVTYYLRAMQDKRMPGFMIVYMLVLFVITTVIYHFRSNK